MRVLVVTPEAPAPHHVNGGATRQFQLLKRLAELGHEITVAAAFSHSQKSMADELCSFGFEVIASQRPKSRLIEVARSLLRRPSLLLAATRSSIKELIALVIWVDLKPSVELLLESREFDVVMIESEGARGWIADLETRAPTVLTIYEYESTQLFAKASRTDPVATRLKRSNARRALASERQFIPQFDAVVTMSSEESKRLADAVPGHPPACVVGNGADPTAFEIVVPSPGHNRVLFAGTMVFPPNRSASQWLAREIWPLVLERVPDASLEIVGRAPGAATRALGKLPGVTVTADAPTMTPHLSTADVCVVPMLEGGGTRLKLFDAMAAGRAIVATTNGVDGVDVRDRSELLIADDAPGFASSIIALLEDADLRERLATVARATVQAHYTWSVLGNRLAEVLESLVGAGSDVAAEKPQAAEV